MAKHCWITSTSFQKNKDPKTSTLLVEYDSKDFFGDPVWQEIWTELLEEAGSIYSAVFEVGNGRWRIEGPTGFVVVDYDIGYTEEEMVERGLIESKIHLDPKVWGGITV